MNDRFLRACRRQPVDATPVWFMRQAGRALPEFRAIRARASFAEIARDPSLVADVTLQPVGRLGVDAAIVFADITTPLAGIGLGVQIVDGVGPVVERPVRDRRDVERLVPFDPDAVAPLLDAIRLVRAASPVPVIGFAGAPFTLASYLVDGPGSGHATRLRRLKDLIHRDPRTAGGLLERLTDMTLAYLAVQVGAGAQAVQVFDSWVGELAPYDYDRTVAPQMRRLFQGLGRLGVPAIHFGTGTGGLLERMARAGGDVLGLDWRVALGSAWERVGHDRAVQGNLDPAVLLGPWEGVAEQARWVLAEAAGRPGHVFNLGHGVRPETDPHRLRRLVDLVHEETAREPVTTAAAVT